MEHVVLYDEHAGSRIDALLNPESLTWRRRAGLRERRLDELPIADAGASDDRLIHTGGGRTEIDLELLFDTRLLPEAGQPGAPEDVRRLTGRLWALTESRPPDAQGPWPRPLSLVWGEWSVPVVVTAVAERFEEFTAAGAPRRSWMTLAMRRVAVDEGRGGAPAGPAAIGVAVDDRLEGVAADDLVSIGSGGGGVAMPGLTGGSPLRLDLAAALALGDPREWRLLAEINGLEDPLAPAPGGTLLAPRPEVGP